MTHIKSPRGTPAHRRPRRPASGRLRGVEGQGRTSRSVHRRERGRGRPPRHLTLRCPLLPAHPPPLRKVEVARRPCRRSRIPRPCRGDECSRRFRCASWGAGIGGAKAGSGTRGRCVVGSAPARARRVQRSREHRRGRPLGMGVGVRGDGARSHLRRPLRPPCGEGEHGRSAAPAGGPLYLVARPPRPHPRRRLRHLGADTRAPRRETCSRCPSPTGWHWSRARRAPVSAPPPWLGYAIR